MAEIKYSRGKQELHGRKKSYTAEVDTHDGNKNVTAEVKYLRRK